MLNLSGQTVENLQKSNKSHSYRLITMSINLCFNFCEKAPHHVLVLGVKLPLVLALCVSLYHRRGTKCSMSPELHPLRPSLPCLGDYTVVWESKCWQWSFVASYQSLRHRLGMKDNNISLKLPILLFLLAESPRRLWISLVFFLSTKTGMQGAMQQRRLSRLADPLE